MSKSRAQPMVDRRHELQAPFPYLKASDLVSVDGLSIATTLPQGVEDDGVSALSAVLLSLGEGIAGVHSHGPLEQVYFGGI